LTCVKPRRRVAELPFAAERTQIADVPASAGRKGCDMTYKTVLVHLDDTSRASDRLDFAIEFARAFKAHLVAIYVMQPSFVPIIEGEASALVMQTLIERARGLKEEKRRNFERRAEVEDFIDFISQRDSDLQLTRAATRAAEPAFAQVWSNPEDDVYDRA